jgi:hypothetical protein
MRSVRQMFLGSMFPVSISQGGRWEAVEVGDLNDVSTREAGLEVGVEDGDDGNFAVSTANKNMDLGMSFR